MMVRVPAAVLVSQGVSLPPPSSWMVRRILRVSVRPLQRQRAGRGVQGLPQVAEQDRPAQPGGTLCGGPG